MGLLKNIKRFLEMSNEDAVRQFVAFELSIEYKIENNIKLNVNEMTFYYQRKEELALKLGITDELHQQLRNEMKDKGILLGRVKITIYEDNKYNIYNTFDNSVDEFCFLLYMIDRVLCEIEEPKHMQNIAALAARYMSDLKNGRSELSSFFNNYKKRKKGENLNVVFEINHELLNKPKMGGDHLYIWTEGTPHVNNFDGKLGIATMLYVIDLMDRLDYEDQKFHADAYMAMLQLYYNTKFPTSETITVAPSIIINKMLKS